MLRSRAYRVFMLMEFMVALCLTMIHLASAVYFVQIVRLEPFQLVLLGTSLEVTIFLFEVPTGVLADTYSRRLSVILGIALLGIGWVVAALVPIFLPILLLQIVKAWGYTFISGAQQAWITDEIGEEAANRAFLRASQLGTVASVLGTLGAMLLGSNNPSVPIFIGGALLISLALLLLVIMPEHGFKPSREHRESPLGAMYRTFKGGIKVVRGSTVLITIIAVGFIFGVFSEGYDRLNEYHWINNVGFPSPFEPLVWFGIIGIATVPLRLVVTEMLHRRLEMGSAQAIARALWFINGALITALLVFAWSASFGLALIAYILIGQLRGLNSPLYTAWLNRNLDPQTRATVISMSAQADALGEIAGGPFVGAIGNFSVRVALTISAVLLSPALWLFRRAVRQEQADLASQPVSLDAD